MRFSRRKPPENIEVQVSTLIRWLIFDTGVPQNEHLMSELGLTPTSEEVDEMEQRASDERLSRVIPVIGIISAYATIVANVCVAHVLSDQANQTFSAEVRENVRSNFETVSRGALVGFLSGFIELGLFEPKYLGDNR